MAKHYSLFFAFIVLELVAILATCFKHDSSSSLTDVMMKPVDGVLNQKLDLDQAQFESIDNDLFASQQEAKLLAEKLKSEAREANPEPSQSNVDLEQSIEEKPTLFGRLTTLVARAIAPARNYYNLIQRYRKWLADYNEVKQTIEKDNADLNVRNAIEWVRIEYAKLDKELMMSACQREPEKKEPDIESVDFVMQILHQLIGKLEQVLIEIKQSKNNREELIKLNALSSKLEQAQQEQQLAESTSELQANEPAQMEDVEVDRALARARRIALSSLGHVATVESIRLLKMMLYNAMATAIVSRREQMSGTEQDESHNVLAYLEPIVLLLGSANTPLAISYLRNIQFRASLALINHSINTVRSCSRSSSKTK